MDVNKLVEEIVKPFLMENDNSSNYDGGVPAVKNEDNYPIGKQKPSIGEVSVAIPGILAKSSIPAIQNLSSAVDNSIMVGYLNSRPDILQMVSDKLSEPHDPNVDASWEERNRDMADKIGYDIVDWIDNEKQVDVEYDDDSLFMDIKGNLCEEFSMRLKIRELLKKSI